tara:strand:+ start:320 stop:1039 length:720 start_codon:yes stop_codon:yes gene_type:complete
MKDIPRVLPLSVVLLLLILFAMCGCRGGRSLGSGSAGTVIIPKTPQEINERSLPPPDIVLPPLEPLAPIPIIPPATTHTNAVRSKPVIPNPQSVKANPVVSTPKASGESTPFSPTVSTTPLTKLPTARAEKLPPKIVEGDGGCVVITDSNGKPEGWCGTKDPEIAGPCEAKPTGTDWPQLIYYWLFVVFAIIFGWIAYDIVQGFLKERKLRKEESNNAKKSQSKLIKKPTKRKRKPKKK